MPDPIQEQETQTNSTNANPSNASVLPTSDNQEEGKKTAQPEGGESSSEENKLKEANEAEEEAQRAAQKAAEEARENEIAEIKELDKAKEKIRTFSSENSKLQDKVKSLETIVDDFFNAEVKGLTEDEKKMIEGFSESSSERLRLLSTLKANGKIGSTKKGRRASLVDTSRNATQTETSGDKPKTLEEARKSMRQKARRRQ